MQEAEFLYTLHPAFPHDNILYNLARGLTPGDSHGVVLLTNLLTSLSFTSVSPDVPFLVQDPPRPTDRIPSSCLAGVRHARAVPRALLVFPDLDTLKGTGQGFCGPPLSAALSDDSSRFDSGCEFLLISQDRCHVRLGAGY